MDVFFLVAYVGGGARVGVSGVGVGVGVSGACVDVGVSGGVPVGVVYRFSSVVDSGWVVVGVVVFILTEEEVMCVVEENEEQRKILFRTIFSGIIGHFERTIDRIELFFSFCQSIRLPCSLIISFVLSCLLRIFMC
jgi:hypothetical protein